MIFKTSLALFVLGALLELVPRLWRLHHAMKRERIDPAAGSDEPTIPPAV